MTSPDGFPSVLSLTHDLVLECSDVEREPTEVACSVDGSTTVSFVHYGGALGPAKNVSDSSEEMLKDICLHSYG